MTNVLDAIIQKRPQPAGRENVIDQSKSNGMSAMRITRIGTTDEVRIDLTDAVLPETYHVASGEPAGLRFLIDLT